MTIITRLHIDKTFNFGSTLSTCTKTKIAFKVVLECIIIGIAFIKQTILPGYFSKLRRVKYVVLFLTALISSAATLLPLNQAFAETQPTESLLFLGDRNYPPFEFLQEGRPTGLAVDIFYAVAEEAGLQAELKLVLWSKAQELVLAGQAHGHSLMSATPLREKHYDFSNPITTLTFTLFVNERDKDSVKMDALSDLKIGVTKGGLPFQYLLESHPEVDLVIVRNDVDGIGKLLRRELDAISTSLLTGLYLLQKHGVTGIVPVSGSLVDKKVRMAIRKGNPALLSKINAAIESLQEKGELKAIKDKWLSSYTSTCNWSGTNCYILLGTGVLVIPAFLYFLISRFRARRGRDNETTKS